MEVVVVKEWARVLMVLVVMEAAMVVVWATEQVEVVVKGWDQATSVLVVMEVVKEVVKEEVLPHLLTKV
jgi:hypothetical protein